MKLDLKKRLNRISYTIRHKKAFLKVEKELRGKNTLRGYLHDIDKPFLYLALWLKIEDIQKIHRKHSPHHVENNLLKTKDDLIDSIIDWECARITKPDKPLNAYETLLKLYPHKKDDFLPIIRELLPEQIREVCQKAKLKHQLNSLRYNDKSIKQIYRSKAPYAYTKSLNIER